MKLRIARIVAGLAFMLALPWLLTLSIPEDITLRQSVICWTLGLPMGALMFFWFNEIWKGRM